MTEPLFKAGAGFTMSSRFLSDINADLGTLAPFIDFAPANFPNPSTVQLRGAIITRNGVADAEDATTIPNMAAGDLAADWRDNIGIANTFVGGNKKITVEAATVIDTQGDFEDMNGTFTASDLQHFDAPTNGQLRHLGNNPREFRVFADFTIDGPANDEVALKVVKWDDSASGFVDIGTQVRQINSLVGGRDVCFFNLTTTLTLDQNDYVKLQLANNSGTANLTAELDGAYSVVAR